ncbi:hypothetical protein [Nocardioides caricicola]|uniref:Matrixin family metalloprotease n=1 Tax=Nocardioides caricicola TaxID=634770 RepID=A0ABW0N1J7_9ACTN
MSASFNRNAAAAGALALCLVWTSLHSPAHAHPFSPEVNADNPSQSWCYGASTNGHGKVRDAAAYGMNNLDNQTDMSESGPVPCATDTDVQFAVGNADGNRGLWECLDHSGTNPIICHKARVTFNPAIIETDGGPYEHNLKKTACHEVGHTTGEDHHAAPYGDCLVSGAVNSGHLTYNYDHYIWINTTY